MKPTKCWKGLGQTEFNKIIKIEGPIAILDTKKPTSFEHDLDQEPYAKALSKALENKCGFLISIPFEPKKGWFMRKGKLTFKGRMEIPTFMIQRVSIPNA